MKRLLSDYQYYLKIERAMSPNTVASYCSDIEKFLLWFDADPDKVLPDNILDYLSSRRQLSERSQSRMLSALRSFYNWMLVEG